MDAAEARDLPLLVGACLGGAADRLRQAGEALRILVAHAPHVEVRQLVEEDARDPSPLVRAVGEPAEEDTGPRLPLEADNRVVDEALRRPARGVTQP